jgi:hypothetical protein
MKDKRREHKVLVQRSEEVSLLERGRRRRE